MFFLPARNKALFHPHYILLILGPASWFSLTHLTFVHSFAFIFDQRKSGRKRHVASLQYIEGFGLLFIRTM